MAIVKELLKAWGEIQLELVSPTAVRDAKQYTNLADQHEFAAAVDSFNARLATKLRSVRDNHLARN